MHPLSPQAARIAFECGPLDPSAFRSTLLRVAPSERDAWFDAFLGITDVPADGADLPQGGVPYVPCDVATLLRVVTLAEVQASDTFVDLGAGLGRAAAFVHLVTAARAMGVEVQAGLAQAAQEVLAFLPSVTVIHGDAAAQMPSGTVFLLYCPFGGERLERAFDALEAMGQRQPIRVCCVDMPPVRRAWLTPASATDPSVAVYRSVRSVPAEPS